MLLFYLQEAVDYDILTDELHVFYLQKVPEGSVDAWGNGDVLHSPTKAKRCSRLWSEKEKKCY